MNISAITRNRKTAYSDKQRLQKDKKSLIIKLMRISLVVTVLLLVTLQLLFAMAGKGQSIATEKVTIGLNNEPMETAIKKIELQSVFRFFYHNDDIKQLTHLNLNTDTRTIEQTLKILLENTSLCVRQMDNTILLERIGQQTAYQIKGRILESADKKPIVNASVFLSNATIGTKTAEDGTFSLQNVKPGSYSLVISIIGYETYRQNINLSSDITLPDIILTPKAIALNEVKIKPNPNSALYYQWFKDEFLGTSNLATECKILNPDAVYINFDEATGNLTASSNGFIEIENKALGYKIKYLLNDFELHKNNRNVDQVHYEGSAFFEEMKGKPARQKQWKKRRHEVYEGSTMHFLRSVLQDRITQEGFWALRYAQYPNPLRPTDSLIEAKINYYKKLKSDATTDVDSLAWWTRQNKLPKTIVTLMPELLHKADIIKPTDQQGIFALGLTRSIYSLFINYNKNHVIKISIDNDYLAYRDLGIHAVDNLSSRYNTTNTLVSFNSKYALFDRNGCLVLPNSLTFSGVWGKNRIAELLPVDYEEPLNTNNEKITKSSETQKFSLDQSTPLPDELLKLTAASDSSNKNLAAEKLYLQLDKPYYAVNDTIWFKAYLLNSSYLTASAKSGMMYVDIANDSDKVIKQYRTQVQAGLAWGNISLSDKDFPPGTYVLRAYTNWMRNTGENAFFYQRFYVSSGGENNWLVNSRFKISLDTERVQLQFSNINKMPVAGKPLQLQVLTAKKTLYKQKVQTDANGFLDVNFKLPEKVSHLSLVAESEGKDKKAVIPLALNREDNADLQFLPEGGNLVAGLPAHIGFKAIAEDGNGVNISGIIVNQNQQQVATFRSIHNGMGSFDLLVQPGETYAAKVTFQGGATKTYPLPATKPSGTVLQVKNTMQSDSVDVIISATNDLAQAADGYYLIGRARGIVCYAAIVGFKTDNFVRRKIAKSLFPTGITHFTLMTTKMQPLNERLVFIDHQDNLHIALSANKPNYTDRDSVAINLKVADAQGNPVEGNFSMAVTDDAQVKTDSLHSETILSRFLLTSDLKGFVEAPGYYYPVKTHEAWKALDNLLLTQGWIGYNWQQVLNPPQNQFEAEHEFLVKGRVTNVFNNPVKGTDVVLFSKTPTIVMDTVTDGKGKFAFRDFPVIDTPVFILKGVNKHGKSFNVNVNVDETAPPVFSPPLYPVLMPWYLNTDTTLLNYTKSNARENQLQYFKTNGHVLKEVKITAKKIINDSQNLNGAGNADIVIDERELEAARKKSFLQLLYEKVPGFNEGFMLLTGYTQKAAMNRIFAAFIIDGEVVKNAVGDQFWYYIKGKPVKFIIDGIPLYKIMVMSPPAITNINDYLKSHSAEDIKGIEVITSSRYGAKYVPIEWSDSISPADIAFVEITTRSGSGPAITNTPGTYLYKPIPFIWPKQFYKPRYTVKDTTLLPDLRSTIDWEPNIVTNTNGEAKLSFYTADNASKYSIIIQGCDMNGTLGYQSAIINVKKEKEAMP